MGLRREIWVEELDNYSRRQFLSFFHTRDENGEWEDLTISPLSQPPELPEVMRAAPDSDGSAQTAWKLMKIIDK